MVYASDIEAALQSMADGQKAQQMLRFFKTAPGEYGEKDKFIGLSNPQIRMIVKEIWKETPLSEAVRLVRSPLHEIRLCGLLIMVEQYLKAMRTHNREAMANVFDTYTALHPHVNNWDLVDLSAIKIVGNHEVLNPGITLMDKWINPEGHTLWQQRIAMVSTWILTRHGRPDKCVDRAKKLLSSPHDLLHKAAGWMLREMWKKGYKEELRDFLAENATHMAAVTLSYACEQMPADERHEWQSKRKSPNSSRPQKIIER